MRFELYNVLAALKVQGLVAQTLGAMERWGRYHLTEAGQEAAAEAVRRLDPKTARAIRETARWAAEQGFRTLLADVYAEAPEYARRSVLRAAGSDR